MVRGMVFDKKRKGEMPPHDNDLTNDAARYLNDRHRTVQSEGEEGCNNMLSTKRSHL
jgi:hypothetical protein